jgi:hypothetical protein
MLIKFSTKCTAKIIVNFVMSKVSFEKYCRKKAIMCDCILTYSNAKFCRIPEFGLAEIMCENILAYSNALIYFDF